jgi:hypothetical protein
LSKDKVKRKLNYKIEKIISGGQTGADRAALDFAMENGIPHGGWIPKGRLTEEGPLDSKYQLQETETSHYEERTEKNVLDSDATLIFYYKELTGGSLVTFFFAEKKLRPVLKIDLNQSRDIQKTKDWLMENKVKVLNIAGPRASNAPLIYSDVKKYLQELVNV